MTTFNQISDYFISLSNATGSLITNLKLQKLVYYTQAWYLAVFEEPLFEEDFQAWIHGPVLPQLYDKYKEYQWRPIMREDLGDESLAHFKETFSVGLNAILDDVCEEYFSMDAFALEKSTHEEDPWINARTGLSLDSPSTNIIQKNSMLNYYRQFVSKEN